MVMTPQRPSAGAPEPGAGRTGAARRASAPGGPVQRRVVLRRVHEPTTVNSLLLLGITLFLVGFGLVMVLSSSAVTDYARTHDFFGTASRQALVAAVGLPLMLIISRLPRAFWLRWAWTLLIGSSVLQLMVFTGLGLANGINRNWITIPGGFTLQPSEFIKLALVIWIGVILSARQDSLQDARALATPLVPVSLVALGLVLLGGDLGTGMVVAVLILGCAFFAGVPLRWLVLVLVVGGVAAWVFAMLEPSRVARIEDFLHGVCVYQEGCWQPTHAGYALAAGGFFGVGLGGSAAKWSWIPEVENDFIFAVIGEELGLLGALVVILLYVLLAIACFRVIAGTDDPLARIITGGVMSWLVVQAFVNIAVVLGLLPVLGVPLPFVSAGGSSLLASMLAVGVVLSFARRPGRQALG